MIIYEHWHFLTYTIINNKKYTIHELYIRYKLLVIYLVMYNLHRISCRIPIYYLCSSHVQIPYSIKLYTHDNNIWHFLNSNLGSWEYVLRIMCIKGCFIIQMISLDQAFNTYIIHTHYIIIIWDVIRYVWDIS